MTKIIHVAAAVICDASGPEKRVLATARGYGEFKGRWEFPGGKVEAGESPQQALVREIREELAVEIRVGPCIGRVECDYPAFHLSMDCFWCAIQSGVPVLKEAEAARWLCEAQLYDVDWLPADRSVLGRVAAQLAALSPFDT